MTTLRDVILPGVPRNLFRWFLESPYEQAAPVAAVDPVLPAFVAQTPPSRRYPSPPQDAEGLVEPMGDFAASGRFVETVPFMTIDDLDEPGDPEALSLHGLPIPPEAYASEIERLGEELDARRGDHTFASWLAGVRDHLRTRPWFRILCDLRLMATAGRRRRAEEAALAVATAGAVGQDSQAQLASALHELAQVLRSQGHGGQSFMEGLYAGIGAPPFRHHYQPAPQFVPAPPVVPVAVPPQPVAQAAPPMPAPVVVVTPAAPVVVAPPAVGEGLPVSPAMSPAATAELLSDACHADEPPASIEELLGPAPKPESPKPDEKPGSPS